MKKKHKLNQIISGIDLLLLGFSALFFTLGLILIPEKGGLLKSPWFGDQDFNAISIKSAAGNVIFSILMAVIPIFAVEGGITNIRQGIRMRKQKVNAEKTIWAKLGSIGFYLDIINNLIFLLLFTALLVITFHGFYYITKKITYRFIIYLVTVALYIIARKWLKKVFGKLGKSMKEGNPTYTLTQEGIMIKLVKMMDQNKPEPPPVLIRFDEIEELKVFTYREAEAYLKYQVGPDVMKGINQTKDFINYVKGEIPRPTVYTLSSYGTSTDKRVLIRGNNIFYLITFDKDDISDLLNAYSFYENAGNPADSIKEVNR